MKIAVCEYLLKVNQIMDEGSAAPGPPFIPPVAIDWLGNGVVTAIVEALG